MMDFEEFKQEVKDNILDYLPEEFVDANVRIETVTKNNDVKLDGLVVITEDENIAPNIYLDGYYEAYKDGVDMDEILTRIAEVRLTAMPEQGFDVKDILDFDSVKDKIIPKLINAEMNQELLANRPHMMEADLAIQFMVQVDRSEDGVASCAIDNRMLEGYGIEVDELYQIAMENMERLDPAKVVSMNEILGDSLIKDVMKHSNLSEEEAKIIVEEQLPPDDIGMYVVTNESGINGATSILNDRAMEQVREAIGDDVLVLPSSIHEVIVIPNREDADMNGLVDMVQEINGSLVSPQEFLSDHVYTYSFDSHELIRADKDMYQDIDRSGKVSEKTEYGTESPSKYEEITIKFSDKLVGEPFRGNDGNEYQEISIPNRDAEDKSPWATFVLKSNQIHEDKYGSGMWAKIPSEGSTTIRKDFVTREKDGKKLYDTEERKVPNAELKEMLTPNREKEKQVDTITIKMAKGVVGEPFVGKDGNEYRQVKIPNRDAEDKSPWATFVVRSNQIHEDQFGKGMWMKVPEDGNTTIRKDNPVGEKDGKMQYETTEKKIPNTELKSMVEFYKDKSKTKEAEVEKPVEKTNQKEVAKDEKAPKKQTKEKATAKEEKKETTSLSDRISKKKEQSKEQEASKPEKTKTKSKAKGEEL